MVTGHASAHKKKPPAAGPGARWSVGDGPEAVQASEAIVLACTCFPLVSDLVRELNPDIALLDPATGVLELDGVADGEGPNRLTVGLTGAALSPDVVQENAESLFPGWELEAILPL